MPLMAMSLLASCAKGNDSMKTTVTFSKESVGCTLWYNDVSYAKGAKFKIPAGVDVTLTVEANQDYLPVFEDGLTISEAMTYNFNPNKKEIKIKVANNGKCVIKAISERLKENLDAYSWSEINQLSEMGLAKTYFKIGNTKKIRLKNQTFDHTVRIIDFNHDDLADGSKVGITFEFADVITDSNSMVSVLWNDKSENNDYRQSSLNNFLNTDDDCVFNKLPEDLRNAVKPVDKKVGVLTNDDSWEAMSFDIDTYPKLFPLAYDEITGTHESTVTYEEGTIYEYYKLHDNNDSRIKKMAGAKEDDWGVEYWLRSPCTEYKYVAWLTDFDGTFFPYNVNAYPFAIAPAFCI